jgi:hypothetical protein
VGEFPEHQVLGTIQKDLGPKTAAITKAMTHFTIRIGPGKGRSRDSISLGERIESHASVLGVTGVPGVKAPIEIDAERIMHNLVLNNQVICGTVNAGRASFEEGVQDLVSFMRRFPDAVRALITARMALDDAATPFSRGAESRVSSR